MSKDNDNGQDQPCPGPGPTKHTERSSWTDEEGNRHTLEVIRTVPCPTCGRKSH